MARKTPDQVVRKFQQRISAAGPDYTFGVQNPTRPWVEGYTAASKRMESELQRALSEGRHIRGARAKADKWQARAIEVGAQRFTAAANVAARGFEAVAGDILAAGEAARKAAENLPDTTQEERLQRAVAAMRAISEYWRRKKGL